MSSYETQTTNSFLLATREWQAIGGAAGLMALNVILMYVVTFTPLAGINRLVFAVPIVGSLVYGAVITVGELLAERGFKNNTTPLALVGVLLLETGFALFGGGVLSFVAVDARVLVLGVTGVITTAMTAGIGIYVYARSETDFDHYGRIATGAFLVGLVAILAGSFVSAALLVGFAAILIGFLFRLGYEMWEIRENRGRNVPMQAIGLYVAVAGVFVHILQLVIRALARR
ncbi:MAG: hypothetical protein U5K28_03705 [Halobacteriales archaeon]|nr:hypothetical protein [Halobacteriales archaeon]